MKYCSNCQSSYPNSQSFCPKDGTVLAMKDRYGLTGRIIADKYQIEALVGVGGMSAVYTAQQIGVGRRVAFKILLPHLANNTQHVANLFEREAKTAGQLSHENIATIFDAGHTPDEIAYIAMEWVDGQTLEDEIAQNGPLSLERSAVLLRQICAALDVAHSKLIIHRDLKPSNIMITRRGDGQEQVKVLDFGLAKLANEAKDVLVSTAVGTPHYASPEQFQTGAEIDARTDIYALGVTLYQMLTGRLPFNSGSVHEVIRQHMLEVPPAVRELRPEIPQSIDDLVQRMLAKNPHYRPQKAIEVVFMFERALALMLDDDPSMHLPPELTLQDLPYGANLHVTNQINGQTRGLAEEDLHITSNSFQVRSQRNSSANNFQVRSQRSSGLGSRVNLLDDNSDYPSLAELATSALVPTPNRFSRWFKQHKVAAACAVATFLLLSSIGVFFAAKPLLTEKDTVLVADFINNTRDDVFDVALKHALSVQLAQSPFLNLFPDDKVRETLKFMGRKPDEPLSRDIAREIGQRQGLKAIILGRIDKIASQYAISLQAINSQTGEAFGDIMVEAQNKDQVLQALGQAATSFRQKLGESLSSVEKFNKPIQDATTSSLDALKAYSLGREQNSLRGNPNEALTLYQRAIQLDPNFALAYIGLATIYANKGETELSAANAERAFQLSDRISESEKLTAAFFYHYLVTGDLEKAIETLRLAHQTYPRSASPLINLSVSLGQLGLFEVALNQVQEAIKVDPRNLRALHNRVELLIRLNRFIDANSALNDMTAQKFDTPAMHGLRFQLGMAQDDPALIQQQLDWALSKQDELRASLWQAQAAAFHGKMREATRHYQHISDLQKQSDQLASTQIALGLRQAAFGLEAEARITLASALALSRTTFVKYGVSNPTPYGAFALALAGDGQQAQALLIETTQVAPKNTLATNLWLPVTSAAIALKQLQPEKAIEALRTASTYDAAAFYTSIWLRGQAYLRLNKGREAAGEFQKLLAQRGWEPASVFFPLARLGLARAYAQLGDTTEARKHYEMLFKYWREADVDLPIYAAAKREFAALH
jgi:eukaryotic-like serine/threonine-protein kinase